MNANSHIAQDALALFALQLLEPDEERAVALHVLHCDQCRRELAAFEGDLALLALSVEMRSPPALARERLLREARREGKQAQRPEEEGAGERLPWAAAGQKEVPTRSLVTGTPRRWMPEGVRGGRGAGHVLSRLLPWGGWAVAAALAVMSGNLLHQRDALRGTVSAQADEVQRLQGDAGAARLVLETLTDRTAMRVTLRRSKEAPVPVGRVTYVPDTGSLVFAASEMAPLGPYRTYELWLIPADGRDPMPAGTFVPDTRGNADVVLPSLPKGVRAKAFGITVEDEGGSPTPTMPIVMAGT